MYTISRIHALIKPAMCGTFQRHVDACEADKYRKKFSCYDLLVAMLFATFSNSKSLRILEQRFNAHPTGHYHLRTRAIHRSTLAGAHVTLLQCVQNAIRYMHLAVEDALGMVITNPARYLDRPDLARITRRDVNDVLWLSDVVQLQALSTT